MNEREYLHSARDVTGYDFMIILSANAYISDKHMTEASQLHLLHSLILILSFSTFVAMNTVCLDINYIYFSIHYKVTLFNIVQPYFVMHQNLQKLKYP